MENNRRPHRSAVTPERRSFLGEQRPAAAPTPVVHTSEQPASHRSPASPQPVAKTINLTISTAGIKRLVYKITSVIKRQVVRFVRFVARQKVWRLAGRFARRIATMRLWKHVASWSIWQRIGERARVIWQCIAGWPLWGRIADLYERIVPAKQRRVVARAVANNWVRAGLLVVVLVLLIGDIYPALQPKLQNNVYALGSSESLLGDSSDYIAQKLKFDAKQSTYEFNANYTPQSGPNMLSSGGSTPQITASLGEDAKKGITVNDPVNQLGLTMTPKFDVWPGKQNTSRVVYPLYGNDGWLVYSMHTIGVKEDVLLKRAPGDTADYSYDLGLGSSYVAKMLAGGNIGVYGNTTLSGNVATGTAKDAELLDKARKHAPKNTLLFVIPAPSITGPGKTVSTAKASYRLDGSTLTVHVTGLKQASYPLTIDPSVYVDTAQKFMNGNNETNIDFDVADTLIQKGKTTGARFNQWNATTNLNSTLWQQGIAVAGGYIYQVGGQSFNGQVFSTPGTSSYTVPGSGSVTVTIKAWGAGGGAGAASGSTGVAGPGGGGGFTQTDYTVAAGTSLSVLVGTGGAGGAAAAYGGAGGGYSAVKNGSTFVVQAAGGGGGGGTNGSSGGSGGSGSAGGSGAAAGTGTAGFLGTPGGGGGGAGTSSAGGAAGAAGNSGVAGAAGAANAGGNGAGSAGACNTAVSATGGAGGTGGGGSGGNTAATCANGGGGGGGVFGGGSGGSNNAGLNVNHGAGGGGGGSSAVSGVSTANTTITGGSGTTPGNSSDSFRNTAGVGGTGSTASTGASGTAGIVVITVTGSTVSNTSTVNWAKFNTSDGTITSPNPGTGNCSGWCTSSAYNLPAPRTNMAMLAYNGFLYALGGEDTSCTTANGTGDSGVCKTVYIAKLGANGEPRLWHPTDTNQANWVYWYRASDLSSPRSYAALVAYNNRMYFMGGKTSSGGSASSVTTVEEADVTGNGLPTSWTTTGMTALPQARWGLGAQTYNGHIYIVGGATNLTGASVTPLATVYYITLAADGTMSGGWISTAALSSGLITFGGNFITMWGAYIYVAGGCSVVNTSGYCTSISNTIQLASINADGSLDVWNTDAFSSGAPAADARMAYSLVAWRGYIYEVGGCSGQDPSTGVCTNTLNTINYGVINQDGDASTVAQSSASGTAPCSGGSPKNCNLTSTIGNILDEAAIMNGYLYTMGGCSNTACSTITTGISYQAIASDGSLQRPAACTGTYTDSYCVSSTSLSVGLAAAGTTVFGGRIYLVGGFNTGTQIYYLTINADGSIASVTQNTNNISTLTTGSTNHISALTYTYAYARANPSSAGSSPGNLYIFGGCMDQSVGCSTYSGWVYKCTISTTGVVTTCTDSGQLQIGTIPSQTLIVSGTPTVFTPTGPGLGAMAGAVYANYIYLIGGLAPGVSDMKTARYAKFDNNNNVVAVSGGTWVEGPNQTATGRRRGAGFGYNGYLYVVGGYDGTTTSSILADIEFAKINVSDGSWGAFTTSSVTINQRWGLTVPVSNSYAYVIGGCTAGSPPSSCTTMTSTIQTFQVYNNDSGTAAGYSTGNTIGQDRIGGSSAILNGYIYYVGGCTVMACTSTSGNTYYAPLDANGIIGTWAGGTGGTALPSSATRAWGKLLTTGGSLYYVGGQTGSAATTAQTTIYYANSFTAGAPTWSTATSGLPSARTQFGAAVWNNRLYIVGGYDASGAVNSTVYASPPQASGGNITGTWMTNATSPGNTSFNVARAGLSVVAYANNLYVLGGFDGTNYLNDVQYASLGSKSGTISQSGTSITGTGTSFNSNQVGSKLQYPDGTTTTIVSVSSSTSMTVDVSRTVSAGSGYIILDGSVGSWTYSTSLPTALRDAEAFAANGYLYVVGGRSAATTCRPITLVTPISANTTIATGNNPTGVGEWYETNSKYTSDRYGAAVAYSSGKLYVLGGGCSSFVQNTGPDMRTYYTTLLSQPQVAQYSIMFDTDDDVYPQKWLLNGLDNSVGAYWQLNYRSMSTTTNCNASAMTTFGQNTTVNPVTLGTPGTYTVYNGSGTNINCGRYFYLLITIDSSQSYGYPEDVSRGPTISNLMFEFQARAGNRLMHGQGFTGGLHQPDDTPF